MITDNGDFLSLALAFAALVALIGLGGLLEVFA
jgi:hypothetical protein